MTAKTRTCGAAGLLRGVLCGLALEMGYLLAGGDPLLALGGLVIGGAAGLAGGLVRAAR
jgi:hypothetical protein